MSAIPFLSTLQFKNMLLVVQLLDPQVQYSDLETLAAQLRYAEYLAQEYNYPKNESRPTTSRSDDNRDLLKSAAAYEFDSDDNIWKLKRPSALAYFAMARFNYIIHEYGTDENIKKLQNLGKFRDEGVIGDLPDEYFDTSSLTLRTIKSIRAGETQVFPGVEYVGRKLFSKEPNFKNRDIFAKYNENSFKVARDILNGLKQLSARGEYGYYLQHSLLDNIFNGAYNETTERPNKKLFFEKLHFGLLQKNEPDNKTIEIRYSTIAEYLGLDLGLSPFNVQAMEVLSKEIVQKVSEGHKQTARQNYLLEEAWAGLIGLLHSDGKEPLFPTLLFRPATIQATLKWLVEAGELCILADVNNYTLNPEYGLPGNPRCLK